MRGSSVKKLVKAICFCVIAAFLFVWTSYMLRPVSNLAYNSVAYNPAGELRSFYTEPKDTLDMVYFGGSSCFTSWMPIEAYKQYGFTSYNYSHNAMPATLLKYCIIEAMKTQSPNLIVVDVRSFDSGDWDDPYSDLPLVYREGPIRAITDVMPYSINRIKAIRAAAPKDIYPRGSFYFDIAKYHTNYTAFFSKVAWQYAFYNENSDNKGFNFLKIYTDMSADAYSRDTITKTNPLPDNLNKMYLDLIEFCNSLDCEVLFVIPPWAITDEIEKEHNLRGRYSYMSDVAETNGISFLNMTTMRDEVGLDLQTDYQNASHLNTFGAEKYTAWFGDYIDKRYDLPEHDNKNWDASCKVWEEELEQNKKDIMSLMTANVREIVKEEE
jgi:hypothetical protein